MTQLDPKRPSLGPVVTFALAITFGSVATGATLYFIGATLAGVSSRGLTVLMTGSAVLPIVLELKGKIAPLPERHKQVPRRWTTWRRPSATAAAFGFVLGAGIFTLLHHATIYVLAALLVLAPSPASAVVIAAIYGMTRGLLLLLTWLRRGRSLIEYLPSESVVVSRLLAAVATVALVGALLVLV